VAIASGEPLKMKWQELEKRFYSPSVYRDFQSIDIHNPFNLVEFYLGGEHQIDTYLRDVEKVNTDDGEHRRQRLARTPNTDGYVRSISRKPFFHAARENQRR
jgi:hypothetical protein